MHPFATYVLRSYYKATGWNEDNLYANLTRSSNAILDFTVPRGLHFSISKSPNTLFQTTYSMNALPSLNGSVGYIFTSCDLDVKSSKDVRFKDMVDRFKVYDQPARPVDKEEVFLGGKRVDTRDYLLYGRIYVPTGRLDALYSTRISPTLQALVAAISDPRSDLSQSRSTRSSASPSNVMLSLQHDTGRWCTEYTYSAEDSMFGVRMLHNFGKLWTPAGLGAGEESSVSADPSKVKRVDEEDAMEGGLKGRISAGAEIYFSAKEKSAGVSTGIRFTTLPDATPPSFNLPVESATFPSAAAVASSSSLTQPPTTITALFNPMMGHISGAYAAHVSKDLSLCSRFDFNVYSYESEWTMGTEWWLRSKSKLAALESSGGGGALEASEASSMPSEVTGVVKARFSTSNDVALMWEGRLHNILIGLGVASNLSSHSKPIKALGLELSYFSTE
ncbi:mitochondrial distribution and morphology protein 10 [Auriscalpium vulgare]|uniref:Mitochondrial distribution and morphology protein 10 n=1 Tax=Auriscalpium vulgare TaxID=40419 RepID=A0ACB8S9A7_9AGAM|nr:mitochondrial distribution and morphology protein 10 [Auriscalpium vulgare]